MAPAIVMDNLQALYERYQAAIQAYAERSATGLQEWHQPDIVEFRELQRLLLPHAESGDMNCQYAMASILWIGLCCESKEDVVAGHEVRMKEATRWWIAAAAQGHVYALDNLATSGIGPEAERAREASRVLEQERRDLVGSSHGMPVYGSDFFTELSRRLYGPFDYETRKSF